VKPSSTLIYCFFRCSLALSCLLFSATTLANPVLNSATLPNARVVPLTDTATIFMTTSNTGDMDATNCSVVASQEVGAADISAIDVNWAVSDAGAIIGAQNDLFTVPMGGFTQLIISVAKNASAGPFDNLFNPLFRVECDDDAGSPAWPAVNGAQIFFSDTRQDIIPIVTTPTNDLIANFDADNRLAVISAAAINNTAIANNTGEVETGVGANYLGFQGGGQFDYFACETDLTGSCITEITQCSPERNTACFTTMLGQTPKTFAFFPILPEQRGAFFSPNTYRFAATFFDENGSRIASSSVALNSPAEASAPGSPVGQYELIQRNTTDNAATSLRGGQLLVTENFIIGTFFRAVDLGAFILAFSQEFVGSVDFDSAPTSFLQIVSNINLVDHFEAENSDAVAGANLELDVQPNVGGWFRYRPPQVPLPNDLVEDLIPQLDIDGTMLPVETGDRFVALEDSQMLSILSFTGPSTNVNRQPGGNYEITVDGCLVSVDFDTILDAMTPRVRIISCDSPENPLSPFVGRSILGGTMFSSFATFGIEGFIVAVFEDTDPEQSQSITINFRIIDDTAGSSTGLVAASSANSHLPWVNALGDQTGKPVYWVNKDGQKSLVYEPK